LRVHDGWRGAGGQHSGKACLTNKGTTFHAQSPVKNPVKGWKYLRRGEF
jgi:hypothetical protein